MSQVYGYARISRPQQSIDRQIRNIIAENKDAIIYQEAYTGTKVYERKELDKLLKKVKPGDTIIFDSVSRMSRNAPDGVKLYFELYNKGINLVFLKEPYINSETYNNAKQKRIDAHINTGKQSTDTLVNHILTDVNQFIVDLAAEQIELAFQQAEKEVLDLRQRTKEGIQTARLNGRQIGQKQGSKLAVKKAAPAKAIILKHSRDFSGTLSDGEVIKLCGIARNTYYKYKRELAAEVAEIDENEPSHL